MTREEAAEEANRLKQKVDDPEVVGFVDKFLALLEVNIAKSNQN